MTMLEELFFHKLNVARYNNILKGLNMKGITITIKPDSTFGYGIVVSRGKLSYTVVTPTLQDAFKQLQTKAFSNFVQVFLG